MKSKQARSAENTPAASPAASTEPADAGPTEPEPSPNAPRQPGSEASPQESPSTPPPKAQTSIPAILFEGDEPGAPLLEVPGNKFASGPASSSEAPAGEDKLPATYRTGRLLLLAREPRSLYAHWDLTDEQQQALNTPAARQGLVLRVCQGGSSGQRVDEIDLPQEARHRFIAVEQPGATYVAELGYYQPEGVWHPLAGSGTVETPPETAAQERTVQFGTFSQGVQAPELAGGQQQERLALPGVQAADFRPPGQPPSETALAPKTSPSDLGKEFPLAIFRPQACVAPAMHQTHPVRGGRGAPKASGRPLLAAQWSPEQEQSLAELIGWTLLRREWMSSEEILELVQGRPAAQSEFHFLEPGQIFGDAARELPALEVGGVSSAAGGQMPNAKGFWFNVNAELIIYGATEPGAQVTLGGRPLQLRPDGTFSFRFALPDGLHWIRAEAVSVEGEVRRAELSISRGTAYTGEVGVHPQDPSLQAPGAEGIA